MCLVFAYYYFQAKIYKRDNLDYHVNSEFNKDVEIFNWLINIGNGYDETNDSTFKIIQSDSLQFSKLTDNSKVKLNLLVLENALDALSKAIETDAEVKFHMVLIDSLKNQQSTDEWERKALSSVAKSGNNYDEFINSDSIEVYKIMKPVFMKNRQLSGNSDIDNPGKFVGGISIEVDLSTLNKVFYSKLKTYIITFVTIWLIGVIVFIIIYRAILKGEQERLIIIEDLKNLKDNLKKTVLERTAEITRNKEKLQKEVEERRLAQLRLEESQKMYKNIIEHSTNLFYSHDTENRFTYISPLVETFLDCKPEDMPETWLEFISDNPLNKLGENYTAKAIETGIAQPPYEMELQTKKGRKIWVEIHEAPVVENGKTVEIVGALVDITEWKIASLKLQQSEAEFKELFSSAPDGICLLDEKGFIKSCNEAYAKMLNYDIDEVLNTHITDSLHDDYKGLFAKLFPKLLEKGELLLNRVELVNKQGTTIKVRRNAKVVYNNKTEISGVILHTQNITELVDKSDIIEENEKLLSLTQKIAGIGSFKYDIKTDKWTSSPVLLNLMEIDSNYPHNFKGWAQLMHPEDQKWVMEKISDPLVRENKRLDFICRVYTYKTNKIKWVNVAGEFELDERGEILSVIGSLQDITDKYLSDKKLEEREAHLRTIFEAANDVSFITTSLNENESKVLSISPGTTKIFGYSADEIINMPVNVLHTEQDQAEFAKNLDKMKRGYVGFQGETEMIHKSGKKLDVFHRAYPLQFENGQLKTGLAVTIDISEIKKAREDLKKREDQLTTLINSSPDIIYFKDGNGNWLLANNTVIKLFGLDVNNYIGKSNSELSESSISYTKFMLEEDELDELAWKSNTTQRKNRKLILSDGRVRLFDSVRVALLNDDGSRKGLLVVARDITNQKELEHKLINSKKLEAVGLMASRLAHEFKNILQSITGFSQFAQDGLNDKDPRYHDIQNVINAAEKADSVVKKLLSAAKKFEVTLVKHNINSVLSSFINTAQNSLGEAIEIEFRPKPEVEYVQCDATHIELVLLNLVLNSKDAMPGGGQIYISVEKVKLNDNVFHVYEWLKTTNFICIIVKDNGEGMSKEVVDSLFEPFFTTKSPGKGTGLGLSSSFDIIKSHGGFIDVKSEKGLGSEFFVYIPLSE